MLFFPVLLLAELFLLVLLLPVVLRLERVFAVLLFAVPLLELLFAGLLFAVPLLELLLAELFLLVLFLPVLRLELLFAVLFLPVLLELLLAVFLLELLLAVLLLLAPERFFAPLRFRDEPPRPPFDSASMSSSFRIREAPAIPARTARLLSSATVMSSMLRATSAPSPIVPLTCAVATPVRPPLITSPSAAPPDARAEASRHARGRRRFRVEQATPGGNRASPRPVHPMSRRSRRGSFARPTQLDGAVHVRNEPGSLRAEGPPGFGTVGAGYPQHGVGDPAPRGIHPPGVRVDAERLPEQPCRVDRRRPAATLAVRFPFATVRRRSAWMRRKWGMTREPRVERRPCT